MGFDVVEGFFRIAEYPYASYSYREWAVFVTSLSYMTL